MQHVRWSSILPALALASLSAFAATPTLKIKLKNNSPLEEKKKEQLERLAAQYDLKKYTITRDILIEQGVRPHSSPVLTLNGRFLDNDDLALAVYIHEQGHWVLMERHRGEMRDLFADLNRAFPGIPSDFPRGSGETMDTYLHLVVCTLEWDGLADVVGAERAKAAMELMKADHYTAIYQVVLENHEKLEAIMKRYGIKF